MIVLCIEGKEACVEEGICMESNRSLSRSLERCEKEPGRLRCFIYTPVSTIQLVRERNECVRVSEAEIERVMSN